MVLGRRHFGLTSLGAAWIQRTMTEFGPSAPEHCNLLPVRQTQPRALRLAFITKVLPFGRSTRPDDCYLLLDLSAAESMRPTIRDSGRTFPVILPWWLAKACEHL